MRCQFILCSHLERKQIFSQTLEKGETSAIVAHISVIYFLNTSQHCAIINPIAVTTKGGRLACASPVQTTLICGEAQVCDNV